MSIKITSSSENGLLFLELLAESNLSLKTEKSGWSEQFVDINIEITEDRLSFKVGNEGLITKVLTEIVDYYTSSGIELEYGTDTLKLIESVQSNNREFEHFIEHARNIWHGDFSMAEFDLFLQIAKAGLIRVPFEKQLLSSFHLFFSKNACNFSVPGTGKTTILYTAFNAMRNGGEIETLVVICPLSAFDTWIEEYFECFGILPKCIKVQGPRSIVDLPGKIAYHEEIDILLINYDKFNFENKYSQSIRYFLQSYKCMIVLDEAHRIKNPTGVQAQTILDFLPYARSRVVLTGTPITQSYADLYNISKFIYPHRHILKYSLNDLIRISTNPNRFKADIDILIHDFSPFFTRIRKSHFELPEAIDNPSIALQPTSAELIIIKSLQGKKGQSLKGNFIRQLQASTNPFLLKQAIDWSEFEETDEESTSQDTFEVDDEIKSFIDENHIELGTKIKASAEKALEIIEMGRKVIIWCIFTDTAERIYKSISPYYNGVLLLGRGNPIANRNNLKHNIENRESAIQEFKLNPEIMFAIANPMAVGEAISLHKNSRNESVCKDAIYLERSFNCAQYLQSRDRIHRVGMIGDNPVNYHFFHFNDSIDKRLDEALRQKLQLMNSVVESQEIPLFLNFDREVLEEVMRNW